MCLVTIVKCPYCGFEFTVSSEQRYENKLEYCPMEDGGCDRMMVVETTARISARALKVEPVKRCIEELGECG